MSPYFDSYNTSILAIPAYVIRKYNLSYEMSSAVCRLT